MENIKKKRNVCEISLLVYIQVFGSGYFLFVCIRQMATYITVVGLLFFPAKHSWTAKVASSMTKPILGKKMQPFRIKNVLITSIFKNYFPTLS